MQKTLATVVVTGAALLALAGPAFAGEPYPIPPAIPTPPRDDL